MSAASGGNNITGLVTQKKKQNVSVPVWEYFGFSPKVEPLCTLGRFCLRTTARQTSTFGTSVFKSPNNNQLKNSAYFLSICYSKDYKC